MHYLAAGHLHLHQEKIIGNTLVAYPGSTERRSFHEETDSEKGFIYLELDAEGIKEHKFITVPAREMKTFEYLAKGDENYDISKDIIEKALQFSNRELIFRIRVRGDITLETLKRYSRDKIIRSLMDKFFIVFLIDNELKYKGEYVSAPLYRLSPLKTFEEYMNKLLENTQSEEEKRKILRAKEIGLQYLREAGAW